MQAAVKEGIDVQVLVVTDGRMGYCTLEQRDHITEIRRKETYDSFKLLARAVTSGGDPAAYVRGVTTYDGVAGTVTRDSSQGGNFRSRPGVWVIENGRPRELRP